MVQLAKKISEALSSSDEWHKGYEILKKIYESDESVVYQARRISDSLHVALRISTMSYSLKNPYRTRLKHENVIRCLKKSVLKINNINYHLSFLEWGGIENLRQIIVQNKPIDVSVIFQLLYGLSYLHSQSIVHGDLKPENILINTNDKTAKLKIIDYGNQTRLLDGTFKITPEYAPPEYQDGSNIQADIWALGCIIYEILTGSVLFKNTNTSREVAQNDRQAKLSFNRIKNLPEPYRYICFRCLQTETDRRFRSVNEIIELITSPTPLKIRLKMMKHYLLYA